MTCGYCAGPVKWTVIADSLHYSCQRQCDGFMQMDIFDTLAEDPKAGYVDRVGSVSALDEDEDMLPF